MRSRTVAVDAVAAVLLAGLALAIVTMPSGGGNATSTGGTNTSGTPQSTELENLGYRIWISDVVFPPNLGWSSDWQDFGSGPHLGSVTPKNSTTMVITAQSGGILAYSDPAQGRFEIILSKNYSQNNFSPGLRAGDVVVFTQVSPGQSSVMDTPTYGNVEVDSVFCNVTLDRQGTVYHGFGIWAYYTGQRFSDPSPGTTNSVSGWVETPSFILTFADNYGWSSYTGNLVWRDNGKSEAVVATATDTSGSCTGYALSLSSTRGTVSIDIPTLKLLLGTPCSSSQGTISESFGAASSNQGNGWAFIGVTK